MLGPLASGIVYVKKSRFERLRPILLGASNVRSPDFIAQPEIVFLDTAARYEPGVLNLGPILGMKASLDLILAVGPEVGRGADRIAGPTAGRGLGELGFEPAGPVEGPNASGILAVTHPTRGDVRVVPGLAGKPRDRVAAARPAAPGVPAVVTALLQRRRRKSTAPCRLCASSGLT